MEPTSIFNVTDITVAVLVILGVLGGLRRGLSGELTRLICVLAGFFAAWRFFPQGAEWLSNRTELSARDLNWISFAAIAAIVYFVLSIVRLLLRLMLDFAFKGRVERIGGALFGFARSIVFCIAFLFAAALIPSEPVNEKLQASYSGSLVIEHLVPVYREWADENPDFQLPEIAPVEDVDLEEVPWDDYLGPLIEDIRTGEEKAE